MRVWTKEEVESIPLYVGNKKVRALEIQNVMEIGFDQTTDENPIFELEFSDQRFANDRVNLRGKPTPKAGWYLVFYEDGYTSFSPPSAFKTGYTLFEIVIENAARAAHEANRILCLALGDKSQPKWEDAPEWQKSSAVSGVKMIVTNPETTPEQSHEGWLKVKKEDGWKYGPVKNPETKEHPCFVPYNELPPEQRLKDEMFGMVVRAVLGI